MSLNTEFRTFFDTHASMAATFRAITPDSYPHYGVKRGLRNDDGTGVLVGLTEIGDVHGYIIDEQERIPVEGRLRYRGISVADLVAGFQADRRPGFEETAYLLLFGSLPTAARLQEFVEVMEAARKLPAGYAEDLILRQPSPDIMNKLARSILTAYSFDPDAEDYRIVNILRQSVELIARLPTMVAYAFQSKERFYAGKSMHIHDPLPGLSTAENFLRMIRQSGECDPLEAEILDLALVLHAEHGGGNNSSFTVRVVSSAYTDTYSAMAAAVGSLKGTRHGGANNRVITMMEELKQEVRDWSDRVAVRNYLTRLIRKEAGDRSGLVYGMGHAIYTLSDPRAELLKQRAEALVKAKDQVWQDEFALYNLVAELTPEVFRDVKKHDKVISPNVDFYSGLVYRMMGIPPELFTPIFAISRIAGWTAHRIEELSGDSRIIRPAYKNVLGKQDYLAMSARS